MRLIRHRFDSRAERIARQHDDAAAWLAIHEAERIAAEREAKRASNVNWLTHGGDKSTYAVRFYGSSWTKEISHGPAYMPEMRKADVAGRRRRP